MIPKLYTSPAWDPRAGGEAIRRSSGAVHNFSVDQKLGVIEGRAPRLKDKALYVLIGEGKLANAIIKVRQHGLIIPRKERVIQFKVSWEPGSG